MKSLFASIVATVLIAGSAQASDWVSVAANGLSNTSSTWNLVSGTDLGSDGLPDPGDNITIAAGTKVWFNQSTDFANVIVNGEMNGADASMTAPIAVVHKWTNATIAGPCELVDGRVQGTVTYDVENLTLAAAGQMFSARFGAATKAEQTVPFIKIGTLFTISSSAGFPIYPLNFGGTFYSMAQLRFSGAGAATVNITVPTTVEFGSITVPAGKSVTFQGAGEGIYVGNDLLTDAPNPFLVQSGGEALVEGSTPASLVFFWGPGFAQTEANAIIGASLPAGIQSGWKNVFSLVGAPSIHANTVFKYFGGQNQALGDLIGASIYKLILDKSAGAVNMEKDLTVAKLDLLNGTINTGAFTLTGPNTLADLLQTNGNVVGNWVKPWLSAVSNWMSY